MPTIYLLFRQPPRGSRVGNLGRSRPALPHASPGVTADAPQFRRVCPAPSESHSALPERSGGPRAHPPESSCRSLCTLGHFLWLPSSESSEGDAP